MRNETRARISSREPLARQNCAAPCGASIAKLIATAAGYLDAEQFWKESAAIGTELQSQYRSWEELAQSFERGMQTWQRSRGITDPDELGRVQRHLPKLRSEIWPAVSFDARLAIED